MKSTLDNEEVKKKLSAEEIASAQSVLQDTLKWLDSNQLAEKDEFVDKKKELEEIVRPMMSMIYQKGGQYCGQEQRSSSDHSGPTIEEVD